jgi:UTP-glucose-1-phosphate uridylyltransferase
LIPAPRIGSGSDLVTRTRRERSGRFPSSPSDSRPLEPGVLAIDRLHDKAPGRFAVAESATAPLLRACGRYVFGTEIFALLAESRRAAAGELDEVPVVQRLAREHSLLGALLPMPLFDVGHPSGLLAASAYLASREGLVPTAEPS